MGTNRLPLWSIITALLLAATACEPPQSRIIGTWRDDLAIRNREIVDKGGLVLRADGTMENSVYLPDGRSHKSKGTYKFEDGVLVVTETESYAIDQSGMRSGQQPRVWGGPVTFFSSNEIEINERTQGPTRLNRQK